MIRCTALLVVGLFSACAGRVEPTPVVPSSGGVTPPAESPTPTNASAPSPGSDAATPPSAVAPGVRPKSDPPPPPLSSPNAPAARADAGADAAAIDTAHGDPRTRALSALGRAAQACHAQFVPTASGKLVLRLNLKLDGSVSAASIDRAASDKALANGDFERCLLDVARKQMLPAPDSDDVELELPLGFEPTG